MLIKRWLTAIVIVHSMFIAVYAQGYMPHYDHIVIVVEENHAFNELIGSNNAPFINSLANNGALFNNSHGVGHPSQPNYLALYSGSTHNITSDVCLDDNTPFNTPNLGAALINKGLSFKGYAENMPSEGYLGCRLYFSHYTVGYKYGRKHTPWVNWIGSCVNCIPASASVPFTAFPAAKDFDKLPTVAFVIPDMDNDMHNIGMAGDAAAIRRGDKWLKDNLSEYTAWAKKHNSLLIITFDEDDYSTKNANRIPTIFYGDKVSRGEYPELINHYNVLHTIEVMYDLPATEKIPPSPITDAWKK